MTDPPWPAGTATGIGSLPGTDPAEAARTVVGELPDLPHLPELPARGVGADLLGRAAALLVDIAVELVPSGYRVSVRPGGEHRRAVDHLRRDLDAFEEALAGQAAAVVKIQLAGPWTLAAGVELRTGHKVITDSGALREFGESLAEGLGRHVADVARRTGARVVVQLDEPGLPAVLGGAVPTPSGFGTVPAVAPNEVQSGLRVLVDAGRAAGATVAVHCCAPQPPTAVLAGCGADAISVDATGLAEAKGEVLDAIGMAWDSGTALWLGLVPAVDPVAVPSLHEAARPALELIDRIGFPRGLLVDRAVPTPTCGLAGASPEWARTAMTLVRELGRAFVEPPESW